MDSTSDYRFTCGGTVAMAGKPKGPGGELDDLPALAAALASAEAEHGAAVPASVLRLRARERWLRLVLAGALWPGGLADFLAAFGLSVAAAWAAAASLLGMAVYLLLAALVNRGLREVPRGEPPPAASQPFRATAGLSSWHLAFIWGFPWWAVSVFWPLFWVGGGGRAAFDLALTVAASTALDCVLLGAGLLWRAESADGVAAFVVSSVLNWLLFLPAALVILAAAGLPDLAGFGLMAACSQSVGLAALAAAAGAAAPIPHLANGAAARGFPFSLYSPRLAGSLPLRAAVSARGWGLAVPLLGTIVVTGAIPVAWGFLSGFSPRLTGIAVFNVALAVFAFAALRVRSQSWLGPPTRGRT